MKSLTLIAPEVLAAAKDAGMMMAPVKVRLASALQPNGTWVLVDQTILKHVRLQHYDEELKILLVEAMPHWNGGFALVGLDEGNAFVAGVRPVTRVKHALNELVPEEVIQAQLWRKPVTRQGDWFFYPEDRPRQVELFRCRALDDDHVAERLAVGHGRQWVFGQITHRQHQTVVFDRWQRAIRNRTIRRTGAD